MRVIKSKEVRENMSNKMSGIHVNTMRVLGEYVCVNCLRPLAFETHYKQPNGTRLCVTCNNEKKRILVKGQ